MLSTVKESFLILNSSFREYIMWVGFSFLWGCGVCYPQRQYKIRKRLFVSFEIWTYPSNVWLRVPQRHWSHKVHQKILNRHWCKRSVHIHETRNLKAILPRNPKHCTWNSFLKGETALLSKVERGAIFQWTTHNCFWILLQNFCWNLVIVLASSVAGCQNLIQEKARVYWRQRNKMKENKVNTWPSCNLLKRFSFFTRWANGSEIAKCVRSNFFAILCIDCGKTWKGDSDKFCYFWVTNTIQKCFIWAIMTFIAWLKLEG